MSTQAATNERSGINLSSQSEELQPGKDLLDYAQAYARERPEVVAMWCFGVGFILGWKLKPW